MLNGFNKTKNGFFESFNYKSSLEEFAAGAERDSGKAIRKMRTSSKVKNPMTAELHGMASAVFVCKK